MKSSNHDKFFPGLSDLLNLLLARVDLRLIRRSKSELDNLLLDSGGLNKDISRRIFQYERYVETKDLGGSIVECGVGSGQGLAFILNLQNLFQDKRTVYAIDSFEGFPPGSVEDSRTFQLNGKTNYTKYDLNYVQKKLKSLGFTESDISRIKFIKGFIPDSLRACVDVRVALINCDVDLYTSTKDSLNFFSPRLLKGGIVMLDEYDYPRDEIKWPGAKKAIDEFCELNNVQLERGFSDRAFLRKF